MKYFKSDNSDSNDSEGTVNAFAAVNAVTNNFFSDTDVNLDSSPDFLANNILPPEPPVSEINSKVIDT